MSILASLERAYGRLDARGQVPAFGYSTQTIHGCIVLERDGRLSGPPALWHLDERGKRAGRLLDVPYSGGRSGTKPPPYFLWDNTAYVLGVTAKESIDASIRHAAFVDYNLGLLDGIVDEEVTALCQFLKSWSPLQFHEVGFGDDFRDLNLVFRLSNKPNFVHESAAAREAWSRSFAGDIIGDGICLVTGKRDRIARLHPPIGSFEKQVRIVSYNEDAYDSYEHKNGANAPVSELAAFRYTAALNRYLAKGSSNKISIGDASTVFWADASEADAAAAEGIVAQLLGEPVKINETTEAQKVGEILRRIRNGEVWSDIARALSPGLEKDVRFNVLGLAPNAARLSIRFWFEDDFGVLAENYQRFVEEMRIDPPPREPYPAVWRYLSETAVLGKRENVQPNLAGDWMRSILAGTPYPLTLLSTVLMRIRADGEVNGLRAGMLKALLMRNFNREVPVSLDPENRNKGYLLGRLFAAYEQAQSAALGRNVNATIKDKFYGSASATPRKVFAFLERGSANHLSKVGKERPGQRVNLEKTIGGIMGAMDPANDPFPTSLAAEDQALFGLGYYHQRGEFFRKTETAGTEDAQS